MFGMKGALYKDAVCAYCSFECCCRECLTVSVVAGNADAVG